MFRVMSFNVLCWGEGEHSIDNRIPLVTSIIKKYMPDSFGVQEAHKKWIDALVNGLPDYNYVGVENTRRYSTAKTGSPLQTAVISGFPKHRILHQRAGTQPVSELQPM